MILEEETYKEISRTFESASKKSQIVCQCDYCGSMFSRLKHNIERSWRHVKKDSCSEFVCVQRKRVETNQFLYGTDNAFQSSEVKKKIILTNLKRYGVENPSQNAEIKEKQKKTCLKKHKVANVFKNEEVKDQIKKTTHMGLKDALQNSEFQQKTMEACLATFDKSPDNNYVKVKKEVQDWLNSFGFNFSSNRNLMQDEEIDLCDLEKKLAVEYCGLQLHHEFSPEPRLQNYHVIKNKKCLEKGIQLLTIFSDEWTIREKQCKSHIKSILGINDKRLYARKCSIKEINKQEGRAFFEEYHIQGKNNLGIVFFGLFDGIELVGSMSLGRHNRQFNDMVLDRLCFKDGVQVVGGASKLFSQCTKWAKGKCSEIISFSDNRWSVGKVYKSLEFILTKDYNPDYSYVDIKKPNQRISKQSQKKTNTDCPEGLTEYDWAHLRGLARIWDCGKKRWVFKI